MREGELLLNAVTAAELCAELTPWKLLDVFDRLLAAIAFFLLDIDLFHFQTTRCQGVWVWTVELKDFLLRVKRESLVKLAYLDESALAIEDVLLIYFLLLLRRVFEGILERVLVAILDQVDKTLVVVQGYSEAMLVTDTCKLIFAYFNFLFSK